MAGGGVALEKVSIIKERGAKREMLTERLTAEASIGSNR